MFSVSESGLSLKHQIQTTFDGVGKSAVGCPVQECAPSAWEKGSTRSFTVLKMYTAAPLSHLNANTSQT